MVRVAPEFASGACRKSPHAADSSASGVVAFAAAKFVVLYLVEGEEARGRAPAPSSSTTSASAHTAIAPPTTAQPLHSSSRTDSPNPLVHGRLTQTLVGHTQTTHVVKWPAHDVGECSLVSGAEGGEVLWWERVQHGTSADSVGGAEVGASISRGGDVREGAASAAPSSLPSSSLTLSPPPRAEDVACGEWRVVDSLKGHTGAVHCVDALWQGSARVVVVSASADNTVRVWVREQQHGGEGAGAGSSSASATSHTSPPSVQQFQAVHCLNFGSGFGLAVALTALPFSSTLLLATANDDTKIHLYTITLGGDGAASKEEGKALSSAAASGAAATGATSSSSSSAPAPSTSAALVEKVASLQGHEDWVRALSFATFFDHHDMRSAPSSSPLPSPTACTLMLASGSQDSYLRLWAIRPIKVDGTKDKETAGTSVAAGASSLLARLSIAERAEAQLVQHSFSVPCTNPTTTDTSPPPLSFVPSPSSLTFQVKFDALLVGHDDIVYSARWHPLVPLSSPHPSSSSSTTTATYYQPQVLLSASMDKTMIVWQPDLESGIWMESARVGEVGGNTLGLYGGIFGPRGEYIIAHGYQGAFHVWRAVGSEIDGAGDIVGGAAAAGVESTVSALALLSRSSLAPVVAISGHFAPVVDLDWAAGGSYLLTASEDQTTRVFSSSAPAATSAPSRHASSSSSPSSACRSAVEWHELARPQVHGYDMQCVASINPLRFVSGADEKVLRVFDAPSTFLDTFQRITGIDLSPKGTSDVQDGAAEAGTASGTIPPSHTHHSGALGASVPALGLSNKAVFQDTIASLVVSNNQTNDRLENAVLPFAPATLTTPPFEEHLLQNTLWPEARKLYGHGYELLCVAASHDGVVVASACKATKAEHAAIRLWSVDTWAEVSVLHAHSLSVTQLSFSHNDKWLLSASRDRQWTLFLRDPVNPLHYSLHTAMPKAHERIIWGVSWSGDDSYFVTGSRDRMMKVWACKEGVGGQGDSAAAAAAAAAAGAAGAAGLQRGGKWVLESIVAEAPHSVTAVALSPSGKVSVKRRMLAAGLENGDILLFTCRLVPSISGSAEVPAWFLALVVPRPWAHTADVTRLKWRVLGEGRSGGGEAGKEEEGEEMEMLLASGSRDSFVKLLRVYV